MRSKRCDNAKSKSIYNISHRSLLSVESSKNKKKIKNIKKIKRTLSKLAILHFVQNFAQVIFE